MIVVDQLELARGPGAGGALPRNRFFEPRHPLAYLVPTDNGTSKALSINRLQSINAPNATCCTNSFRAAPRHSMTKIVTLPPALLFCIY